jgi:hypothetical protein
MVGSLIPKHLVFQLVRRDVIANDQAFKVLCALVHERTEHLKGRKHTCVILVDSSTVPQDILT